jgi:hypothetical protein
MAGMVYKRQRVALGSTRAVLVDVGQFRGTVGFPPPAESSVHGEPPPHLRQFFGPLRRSRSCEVAWRVTGLSTVWGCGWHSTASPLT